MDDNETMLGFIENLHYYREDDWKSLARQKLRKFEEELHELEEVNVGRRFPGMKSWNFVNCILYCWTVVTTIGGKKLFYCGNSF